MPHLPRGILKVLSIFVFVSLTFLIILPALQVLAAPTARWNTFGAVKKISAKDVPKVKGVWAFMTTTDTPVLVGQKTAGPVGVTDLVKTFAESGPIKTCALWCEYHPYSSYQDINGIRSERIRADINLLPNGWYEYRTSLFLVNGLWRIEFCDGDGCIVLRDVNLGTNRLPSAIAGGEEIDADFGPVTSAAFKWQNTKWIWANACYTEVVGTVNGQITPCGGNFDWTVQFP